MHYPDFSLCDFYLASLNKCTKVHLPGVGPRGSFAEFVEWVLVNCGSAYTIDPTEDDIVISPTLNTPPETSHPPPLSDLTEILHVPTTDHGDWPATMDKPKPRKRSVEVIALEALPQPASDQVREPATPRISERVLVEYVGLEGSPAHNPATVDVIVKTSGGYFEELKDIFEVDLIDWVGEVIPNVPVSPASPNSSECPSSLPVPPP